MSENLAQEVLDKLKLRQIRAQRPVIVNISNRHIHLKQEDLEKLFGPGYTLKKVRDLLQPGEFASDSFVKIVGPKGEIDNVRVLGPIRRITQIEISRTDDYKLGTSAPVRLSGDIAGSAPIKVIGPKGVLDLKEGCIVAKRHVHMTPADAEFYHLKHGEVIQLRIDNPERGLIFDEVIARVSEKMALECHLDTDEANAAGIKNGDKALIL